MVNGDNTARDAQGEHRTGRDRRTEIYLALAIAAVAVVAIIGQRGCAPTEVYVRPLTMEPAGASSGGQTYVTDDFTVTVPEPWATIALAGGGMGLRDPVSGGTLAVMTIQPVGRSPEDFLRDEHAAQPEGTAFESVPAGGGYMATLYWRAGDDLQWRADVVFLGTVVRFTWTGAPEADGRFRDLLRAVTWRSLYR